MSTGTHGPEQVDRGGFRVELVHPDGTEQFVGLVISDRGASSPFCEAWVEFATGTWPLTGDETLKFVEIASVPPADPCDAAAIWAWLDEEYPGESQGAEVFVHSVLGPFGSPGPGPV